MSAQPLNLYDVDSYTASKKGQVVANYAGDSVELEYTFDVTDGPSATTNTDVKTIPAGSLIEKCEVFVKENLLGGTNFQLGVSTPAGVVTDADGLLAASTVASGYVAGAGALIGTVLAADGQVTYTGSRTSGVLKVLVTYTKP